MLNKMRSSRIILSRFVRSNKQKKKTHVTLTMTWNGLEQVTGKGLNCTQTTPIGLMYNRDDVLGWLLTKPPLKYTLNRHFRLTWSWENIPGARSLESQRYSGLHCSMIQTCLGNCPLGGKSWSRQAVSPFFNNLLLVVGLTGDLHNLRPVELQRGLRDQVIDKMTLLPSSVNPLLQTDDSDQVQNSTITSLEKSSFVSHHLCSICWHDMKWHGLG